MQVFRTLEHDNAAIVGWGVRVMLLTADSNGEDGATGRRLGGLGGIVEAQSEMFAAVGAVIDDPAGYGLFVMDCDGFGGISAGHKAFTTLGELAARVPVILITKDCPEQTFPKDRSEPLLLRAPVSAVSLRVGFEHALRERMIWHTA